MRPRRASVWLASLAAVATALAASPSGALAARVIVLDGGHRASARNDQFLTTPAMTLVVPRAIGAAAKATGAPRGRSGACVVCAALVRLRHSQAIPSSAYRSYSTTYATALGADRRLRGTRATELAAVIENLREIAAAGLLTASRLPPLFETLDRNRQWWTSGPLLTQYQRVEFSGSQLVWEYYPGQGIELQVLANFGKADGLYTAGSGEYPELRGLLGELTPLAVTRGGGMTWEYYFHFDGGSPPWTSAMSQGTAIEALTRGYEAFGDRSYLDLAHSALSILTVKPPVGVAQPTAQGTRYLQYSFAPGTAILNAFLQTLTGLYDYAQVSGDPLAARLFAAGDAEARAEVPRFDTGAWSLYQPGEEDTLSYHDLVTGFLQNLCDRTHAPVYCVTAQHFQAYLRTAPMLSLLTQIIRGGKPGSISFHLSKYSHVGIVVLLGRGVVFLTSGYFGYGTRAFAVPALKPGHYTVRLAATDLAGNFNRIIGTLSAARAGRRLGGRVGGVSHLG